MLLKTADDKSKRISLLEDLQRSIHIDSFQKKWLHDELMRFKKGIQGEKDSAHYIDNYFKDSKNHIILHDLRFIVDEEVTQIDHLIISRSQKFYLLETKNYSCNLIINEHGEFTANYGGDCFGIPSPLEQSLRHERVLCKLLERLDIFGRTQKTPDIHHIVMLDPKVTIQRPANKLFDTSNVIKSDQFPTWHKNFSEQLGIGSIFNAFLNFRSLETIQEWGEKLKRQHRPVDLFALPEFMRPKTPNRPAPVPQQPQLTPVQVQKPTPTPSIINQTITPTVIPTVIPSTPSEPPAKKLICAHCSAKISFAEGKFCWNRPERFGGAAYCREHQNLF